MLDWKRIAASAPRVRVPESLKPLLTPWGESMDYQHILDKHPHPQFARDRFMVLNGLWDYAIVDDALAKTAWRDAEPPAQFDGQIIVPFTPETLISGVNRRVGPGQLLWYRRVFRPGELPAVGQGERLLLHFEAVDYACACYVNGQNVGCHVGGYLPFTFDITDALADENAADGKTANENTIELCVYDPSDYGVQLRGKQKYNREGMWYTSQSGIWQTVWAEVIPVAHIDHVEILPEAKTGALTLTATVAGEGVFGAIVRDTEGNVVAQGSVPAENGRACLVIQVRDPHLWSLDDPYLYDLEFSFAATGGEGGADMSSDKRTGEGEKDAEEAAEGGADRVRSYCAFRTVELLLAEDGHRYFYLNGEKVFLRGVLDQGYWSDGLMTAPDDEALIYDIKAMKDLGFNMLRKHIKVECDRYYYHCDRLGMLVWQDMVTGGSTYDIWITSYRPTFFRHTWGRFDDETLDNWRPTGAADEDYRREWTESCLATVDYLKNHPCIVTWVLFNESWGQFDARGATELVRRADPTRPIDATSGWYDRQCGDYHSVHNYFRALEFWPEDECPLPAGRAFVISEFGGFNIHLQEHSVLRESYGYEKYDDMGAYQSAVINEIAQVDALQDEGVAGFVFTQVSDVEEETNGLLTYDRKVNKLLAPADFCQAGTGNTCSM